VPRKSELSQFFRLFNDQYVLMPEEPAIMLDKLEGMSTNINKAWLRLMSFLEIQKKKLYLSPYKQ
jgi:hypothetical protein